MRIVILLSFSLSALVGCASSSPKRNVAEDESFPKIDYNKLHKVDVLGIPFGDTVLNEQRTERNVGVNNLNLQDDFALRFAALAEAFAPDLEKLGMESCYKARTPGLKADYREYQSGETKLFNWTSLNRLKKDLWDAKGCFTQRVRFSTNVHWRTSRSPDRIIRLPRVITLFLPNVLTVDLDTTGTWPFGHRPNDQIGGRFTSLFLKMGSNPGDCSGRPKDFFPPASERLAPEVSKCHLDSLNQKIPSPYKHWKKQESAFPLQPPVHVYIDAQGNKIEGVPEEEFPFLLPPNPGRGYYQTKPDVGMD